MSIRIEIADPQALGRQAPKALAELSDALLGRLCLQFGLFFRPAVAAPNLQGN